MDQYKEVCKAINDTMNLADRADPFMDEQAPYQMHVEHLSVAFVTTKKMMVKRKLFQTQKLEKVICNVELNGSLRRWRIWTEKRHQDQTDI